MVFIVDGNYQMHRAMISPIRNFVDKEGRPTGMLIGFLGMLNTRLQNGDKIVVAFDTCPKEGYQRIKNVRKDLYPPYKKGRSRIDGAMEQQIRDCSTMLGYLGVDIVYSPNYEADDAINTVVEWYAGKEPVTIFSADKDLLQMVKKGVDMMLPSGETMTQEKVLAEYGIIPPQIPEMLALAGDKIDNIPGATGIGTKTACKYLAGNRISPRQKALIDQWKDGAQYALNLKLTRLYHDKGLLFLGGQKNRPELEKFLAGRGIKKFGGYIPLWYRRRLW